MRVDGNVLDSAACLFPTIDFHMETALVHCCTQAHTARGRLHHPRLGTAKGAQLQPLTSCQQFVCLTPSSFSQRLKDESALLNHTS